MQNKTESNEPSLQYVAPCAAHDTGHDLPLALERYRKLIASDPDADEAAYSRMQIQNIANAVIPKQAVLEAQESRSLQVATACCSIFDKEANEYRKSPEDQK